MKYTYIVNVDVPDAVNWYDMLDVVHTAVKACVRGTNLGNHVTDDSVVVYYVAECKVNEVHDVVFPPEKKL